MACTEDDRTPPVYAKRGRRRGQAEPHARAILEAAVREAKDEGALARTKGLGAAAVRAGLVVVASTAAGTGLTIRAIDATHVAGSLDYTPPGGARLQATFDLPVCPEISGASCCIP